MTDSPASWSPAGIASAIAIVAGVVLLIAYAVQRGFVHRELEGIEDSAVSETQTPAATNGTPRRSRTLGMLGAVLLVAGLALGLVAALGSWSTGSTTGGPGTGPNDCAQSWNGCPKATAQPQVSPGQ